MECFVFLLFHLSGYVRAALTLWTVELVWEEGHHGLFRMYLKIHIFFTLYTLIKETLVVIKDKAVKDSFVKM